MSEKLHRIWEILNRLNKRETLTPRILAEELGVSERTIFRDFEVINLHFPVLFDKATQTYRFMEGYSLQKLKISKDELMTLLLSREIVSKLGAPLTDRLDSIINKITTQTKSEDPNEPLSFWIDFPEVDFSRISKVYSQIEKGIEERKRIWMRYFDSNQKVTERKVDPYSLIFSDGFCLAVGYCHLRRDIRKFALDFIKEIRLLNEPFEKPIDFDLKKYFKSSFKIWEGELEKVVIRFDKEVSELVMRRKWHHSQKVKKQKNGDLIMEFELSGTEEIKAWIYNWIPYCEVINPLSLRNQVKEELTLAQKLYKK
jgi:predicted DNA-binding transcriptional regulator YafY